jgi:hypothetical protein
MIDGCQNCLYFELSDNIIPTCLAFPFGIPVPLVSGEVFHDKVFEGHQEGNFVWTKKES